MKEHLAQRLRRLFATVPIGKTPIAADDLLGAQTHIDQVHPHHVRAVEQTYDLRWTGRYRFDFAESTAEVVPGKSRGKAGGTIVLAVSKFTAAEVEQATSNAGITSGYSLGNAFRGRYRSPAGSVYNEQSVTVRVLNLSKHDLVKLATLLAQTLALESVLVKSAATGAVYFVAR